MIAWTVHIAGHRRDHRETMLVSERLRKPHAGDLGDCIRLVGRVKRPTHEGVLAHRLRRVARVDTRAAKEKGLRCAEPLAREEEIRLDLEILDQELHRLTDIGRNTPDLCRGNYDYLWRCLGEE